MKRQFILFTVGHIIFDKLKHYSHNNLNIECYGQYGDFYFCYGTFKDKVELPESSNNSNNLDKFNYSLSSYFYQGYLLEIIQDFEQSVGAAENTSDLDLYDDDEFEKSNRMDFILKQIDQMKKTNLKHIEHPSKDQQDSEYYQVFLI